jgi:hypothetical protein
VKSDRRALILARVVAELIVNRVAKPTAELRTQIAGITMILVVLLVEMAVVGMVQIVRMVRMIGMLVLMAVNLLKVIDQQIERYPEQKSEE